MMSKESKTTSSLSSVKFDTEWSDHPIFEWITANKQIILWSIVGLFALLLLSYRILNNKSLNAEGDYLQAQAQFTQFQNGVLNPEKRADSAALQELMAMMKRHPELHAKYDGPLAQTLLIEKQMPEASALAQATFKRTAADSINQYHSYAATSLLIGEGKYSQALEEAKALKATMENTIAATNENTLYLFNLVRIAALNKQLNFLQEEKQAWGLFQNQSTDAAAAVANLFTKGQASLNQYVESRG